MLFINIYMYALRDSLPFLQFTKHEKHPWSSITLVRLQASAWNFTKSSTYPWVFFMFCKFDRWYQIAHSVSYIPVLKELGVIFTWLSSNVNLKNAQIKKFWAFGKGSLLCIYFEICIMYFLLILLFLKHLQLIISKIFWLFVLYTAINVKVVLFEDSFGLCKSCYGDFWAFIPNEFI